MKTPKYEQSFEWRQFDGMDNACFLPHESYKNGMRERPVVHQPNTKSLLQNGIVYL
jgi:hypothetical protein